MVNQELGTAQLMFVHAGQVIVVDTMLTVSGSDGIVVPATFVLAHDPRTIAASRRRRTLARWAAAGAVCSVEVTHIDGHPFLTFAGAGHRLSFRLAGCVSRPRLVIPSEV
jgi:hypothetical protein